MKSAPRPPMTLGNAAAAHVRLMVWHLDCPSDLLQGCGFPGYEKGTQWPRVPS
jgi:hypothetical protein